MFLVKVTRKFGQKRYLWSILCWKLIRGRIKLKIEETIIGSFYKEELLVSKLLMCCYHQSDIHIRDKFKVVLDLPNYATKNN